MLHVFLFFCTDPFTITLRLLWQHKTHKMCVYSEVFGFNLGVVMDFELGLY